MLEPLSPGDESVVASVDRVLLDQAMLHLSERHREVLRQREQLSLSYRQIAELQGVAVSAVETLLFRARRALRREFLALADPEGFAVVALVGLWRLLAKLGVRIASQIKIPPGWSQVLRAGAAGGALVVGAAAISGVVATSGQASSARSGPIEPAPARSVPLPPDHARSPSAPEPIAGRGLPRPGPSRTTSQPGSTHTLVPARPASPAGAPPAPSSEPTMARPPTAPGGLLVAHDLASPTGGFGNTPQPRHVPPRVSPGRRARAVLAAATPLGTPARVQRGALPRPGPGTHPVLAVMPRPGWPSNARRVVSERQARASTAQATAVARGVAVVGRRAMARDDPALALSTRRVIQVRLARARVVGRTVAAALLPGIRRRGSAAHHRSPGVRGIGAAQARRSAGASSSAGLRHRPWRMEPARVRLPAPEQRRTTSPRPASPPRVPYRPRRALRRPAAGAVASTSAGPLPPSRRPGPSAGGGAAPAGNGFGHGRSSSTGAGGPSAGGGAAPAGNGFGHGAMLSSSTGAGGPSARGR